VIKALALPRLCWNPEKRISSLKTQSGNNTRFVLDSTAFFTIFEDEQGADTVQDLLEGANRKEILAFVSFVTFAEIFYVTIRRKGEEEGLRRLALMEALAVTRIESSKELNLIAGRLKALYRISFL
jgi:predicted nucleic acid-binding protein